MKKTKKKRKRKKSLIGKFFNVLFSILSIYFLIILILFSYSYFSFDKNKNVNKENMGLIDKAVEKLKPTVPERTNVLLAVTDESEGRTDGIMLLSYNSVNKKVSIISIPRDTRIKVPGYMWEEMIKNFPGIRNQDPIIKINAIPNFGKERGMEFLKSTIEKMLGININYYAHFNLEGFRYIIDSVGGIEFDVPQRMKYSDPTQNLSINLKPGVQLLDGKKAEELLRFRSYPQGDLKRIEVQQDFIKVFFKKISSLNSILSNPKAYFTTLTKYVDTDFKISDILKYTSEASKISSLETESYTLPCTPKTINGISYVVVDETELLEFGYEIFKKPIVKPEDIVYEDSFDKSIQILNGSYTKGMAKNLKDILENNGYIVGDIGDSSEKKSEDTKIYVANDGYGSDLKKFLTNSKIVVNPSKIEKMGYDIVIIIGTNEELKETSSQ